jgi:hypothetical protein
MVESALLDPDVLVAQRDLGDAIQAAVLPRL